MNTATSRMAPEPESLPPLPSKQELLRYAQELRAVGKRLREIYAIVAYYGWRLKSVEGWTVLGYDSEDSFRESVEIPSSTWYKYVRLGGMLSNLSLEELQSIRSRNLELLTQVTHELWPEHDWVEEARKLEPDAFCELIATRNRARGDAREPTTVYRETVPFSSQQMIKAAVEAFREKHDLASTGRALELMVADQYDRDSYLGAIIKLRRFLSELKVLLQTKGILDMEVHDAVDSARYFAGAFCTQAIEAARKGTRHTGHGDGDNGDFTESSGESGTEEPEVGSVEGPTGTLQSLQ